METVRGEGELAEGGMARRTLWRGKAGRCEGGRKGGEEEERWVDVVFSASEE